MRKKNKLKKEDFCPLLFQLEPPERLRVFQSQQWVWGGGVWEDGVGSGLCSLGEMGG